MPTAKTTTVDPASVPAASQLAFFAEGFDPSQLVKSSSLGDLRPNHWYDPKTKTTYWLPADFDINVAKAEFELNQTVVGSDDPVSNDAPAEPAADSTAK